MSISGKLDLYIIDEIITNILLLTDISSNTESIILAVNTNPTTSLGFQLQENRKKISKTNHSCNTSFTVILNMYATFLTIQFHGEFD